MNDGISKRRVQRRHSNRKGVAVRREIADDAECRTNRPDSVCSSELTLFPEMKDKAWVKRERSPEPWSVALRATSSWSTVMIHLLVISTDPNDPRTVEGAGAMSRVGRVELGTTGLVGVTS